MKNEPNKTLEPRRLPVTISAISALRAGTDRARQPSGSAWALGRKMKTIGYLLFGHVVIAVLLTMATAVPFTNENVKRERIENALRYTAETTAFLEANDPQLNKQFEESKVHTHRVVWEYVDAINNRNSTDGFLLLSFICSNLGIAAYLVFRKSENKK